MQLPPPLHGVTAMNAQIAASTELATRFELDILPLRFSRTIAELGRVSPEKLARTGVIGARLGWRLARHRPAAMYFTLAVQRPAVARDETYLALARMAGVPRIVHLHARPDPVVLPRLRRALCGAWVILLSPALRAELGDAVDDARVRYVPNGLPDRPLSSARGSVPRVLFLSNLLVSKGPLVLVEALAALARRGVAFEATFAGAPSRELDGAALARALELAGLAGRVRYVGAVGEAAKDALFASHDVLALPTERDAFSLVVLEAMRAGLAVVATPEGALPELVGDGGIIAARPEFAAVLERLLTNRPARTDLGARARARFVARYTAAHFERQLATVFGEVVGA